MINLRLKFTSLEAIKKIIKTSGGKMKSRILYLLVIIIAAIFSITASIGRLEATGFHSPSLGGATGLIGTPTAHTGWEGNTVGFDAGVAYTGIGDGSWLPKITFNLFDRWELGATYEFQREHYSHRYDNDDLFLHTKFRFYPWSGGGESALAIGANYMSLKVNGQTQTDCQFYLVATYGGNFFGMPAETTLVFGKTFGDESVNQNIDFSMGFDLDIFPSIFQHYIHWINDYANYFYTYDPMRNVAGARGAFNTGIRIAALKDHKRFKLNFDVLLLDALDDGRSFGFAVCFGMSI
jgi:hypothetical protein